MIQCHWNNFNTFEHYGSGDFNMLGWEALESKTLPLFHFGGLDAEEMHTQLLNSMPGKLFSLASEAPITIDTMRHMLANETAAPFSDLNEILLQLSREKEIEILSPEGKVRSRTLKRLRPTDRIAFPRQLLLPGTSRRRRLDAGYQAMAADTEREAEAQEWCNALAGDVSDETR